MFIPFNKGSIIQKRFYHSQKILSFTKDFILHKRKYFQETKKKQNLVNLTIKNKQNANEFHFQIRLLK